MNEKIAENADEISSEPIIETGDSDAAENDESEETEPSARRTFAIVGGIIAAVFLIIGGYFYLQRNQKTDAAAADEKTEVVVSVKTAKAEKETIAKDVTALGTVAPVEQSSVSASLSAQIKQMRVLKNQYVKQGEVIAVLASQDLQAQRAEAEAAFEEAKLNLQTLQKVTIPQTSAQSQKDLADAQATADNARATFERRKDLYEKGGISLKELDVSQLAMTNADNALRLARQNSALNVSAVNPNARAVAESKIKQAADRVKTIDAQANLAEVRAPISGVVVEQFQFEGEYAAAGAKLITIANVGGIIVKANFADTVISTLKTGDAVAVYASDAPDERMTGKITLISRSSDANNRTVEVQANFVNDRGFLRVGAAVRMVVSSQTFDDAIIVPATAVTLDATNADEGTVMTVDKDSIAHETKIKIGITNGDKIQITEGLGEGATVVVEGNYALPDSTKVEVAKDAEEPESEKKE